MKDIVILLLSKTCMSVITLILSDVLKNLDMIGWEEGQSSH